MTKDRRSLWICAAIVAFAALLLGIAVEMARAERMGGPGLHVYDGDTFSIGSRRYRLAGVDTPEIGSRARCPAERSRGELAREEARRLLARPYRLDPVRTSRRLVKRDKYGRTMALVSLWDGSSLAERLIANGLAVPYDGRGTRKDWCS